MRVTVTKSRCFQQTKKLLQTVNRSTDMQQSREPLGLTCSEILIQPTEGKQANHLLINKQDFFCPKEQKLLMNT